MLAREAEGAPQTERANDRALGEPGLLANDPRGADRWIEARHVGLPERAVVVEPERAGEEHLVAPAELLLRVVPDVDDLIVPDLAWPRIGRWRRRPSRCRAMSPKPDASVPRIAVFVYCVPTDDVP